MRHSLARFAICHVSLSILAFISGCYSLNGYIMNSSGQTFYRQGNYAMAAAEFEKAVASEPSNPDYVANLARTHYKMGDARGAEHIYRRNLTTSPGHQPSYHGLAQLMLTQGRSQEATAMLSTWSATQTHVPESHIELAWLQRELGHPNAAAQTLQQALRVNPGHPKALAHLGQYYQDVGQTHQAIAMYQQSLHSDWNQPQVQSRLATAVATAVPTHPVNAASMARGARPPGFPHPVTARPHSPMQLAQFAPSPVGGPYAPGFLQASHTAAMPFGTGFGFPMAAAPPVSIPAHTPSPPPVPPEEIPDDMASSESAPRPDPDPVFEGQTATPIPATTISHQTLKLPDVPESIPEVEAF